MVEQVQCWKQLSEDSDESSHGSPKPPSLKTISYQQNKGAHKNPWGKTAKMGRGKIHEVLRDCQQIQRKLNSSKKRSSEDISRIFSKLVMEGKISSALKFLDENVDNAVLKSNDEVINKLKQLIAPNAGRDTTKHFNNWSA